MDRCLGLVEDLAFATMFENDNILEPNLCSISIEDELLGVIAKLRLLEDYRTMFANLELTVGVESSVPKIILTDKAIVRVLHNLISNAVRFTPATRGVISISVAFISKPPLLGNVLHPLDDLKLSEEKTNSLENISTAPSTAILDVQTLAEEYLFGDLSFTIKNSVDRIMDVVAVNKAFQHYYDVDSVGTVSTPDSILTASLTATQGVGLGLYVSYNIVEILGGRLECSANDRESAFWFHVPVKYRRFDSSSSSESATSSADKILSTKIENDLEIQPLAHLDNAAAVDSARLGKRFFSRDVNLEERWTCVTASSAAAQHVLLEVTENCNSTNSSNNSSGNLIGNGGMRSSSDQALSSMYTSKRRRVLVVDDSSICQKVLTRTLRSNNYDTDVASNGQVVFFH